jgi:glycosyltransferase involved in cell wall biosynthesis
VIFFLSHPIQYVSPLLRQLSKNTELRVYYYGGSSVSNFDVGFNQILSWDIPLLEGYNYTFLNNISNSKSFNTRFFDAINFDVFKIIKKTDTNIVVLNGWAYLSDWFVLISAKLFGKKIWLRSEMPWNQECLKKNTIKKKFKYFIFKHIVFKFFVDKFLFIGSQNKLFYKMHGVGEDKLVFTPYAVDNNRFQNENCNKEAVRQQWKIPHDAIIILFSGKLISKKRPLDILLAFSKIANKNHYLFYMGDGPLRTEIEDFIKKNTIKNVIISGFINQSEISSIYSISDIFIMTSGIGETWGLSVNEAMNFSLPIIISDTCGSSYDLVLNKNNGFVYNEGNIEELTNYLSFLINNKQQRINMGINSKKIINYFSFEVSCSNILKSINGINR